MSAVYFDERSFADKVMARVAAEPTPTVSAAAGTAVREFNVRLLLGVSWTAWHLATARTAVVRPPLRIKSAALLSVMLLMLAMGTTLAAAGAVAVVQQVTHNFQLPSIPGPNGPAATDPTAHAGGPLPGSSEDPDDAIHDHPGQSAQPSHDPVTGVTDPGNPGATPTDDGNGDDGNDNGQGDHPSPKPTASPGDNGGGKGTHPSPLSTPTATDDGQGDDNGGGNNGGGDDNGGGKGTHASPTPSPSDDGQGDDNGSGENVGGDGNGSGDQASPAASDDGNADAGNGTTDKGGSSGSGDGNSNSEGDNSQ